MSRTNNDTQMFLINTEEGDNRRDETDLPDINMRRYSLNQQNFDTEQY
jgi:hypothetical protein